MKEIILNFPKQFQVGLKAANDIKIKNKFKGVIICGMGGSALPGDVLEMWLGMSKINLPLYIHRSYGLPLFVDKNYLIITISYSGNTEETLTAFQQALKEKLSIAAIASGGRLAELCKKNKIPLANIPSGIPPRMAIGYQFAALIKILSNSGLIRNKLKEILSLEILLKPTSLENQGEKLAKRLKNKIPIIYTSEKLRSLAYIWKIKFNENSKILALTNCFPELNHNELSGFENLQGRFHLILLQDLTDHPRISKRMKLTTEIIKTKGVEVDIIEMKDKSILSKIFSNILLAAWTSYYLALEYGIDPVPVELQEKIKKLLKK